MTLTTDVQILMTEFQHTKRKYRTPYARKHFWHDLVFGATRKEISPRAGPPDLDRPLYTDFHVHLHTDTNIRRALREASKRVDILAITGRTLDSLFDTHHTFDSVLAKCQEHELPYHSLGPNVALVYPYEHKLSDVCASSRPLTLVRATEVYPKEMLGVVAVGGKLNGKYYHGKSKLSHIVADATENVPLWFFDHPFSMPAPGIAFRYPTEDEVKRRRELFQQYHSIIEVGNHQNTLWMYLSNALARDIAEQDDLIGIANSDTHYRVRDIGLSRTGIRGSLFDGVNTQDAFLSSLRIAFSPEHKDKLVVEAGFASAWSFLNYMIVPTLMPSYAPFAVRLGL